MSRLSSTSWGIPKCNKMTRGFVCINQTGVISGFTNISQLFSEKGKWGKWHAMSLFVTGSLSYPLFFQIVR